MPKPGSKPGIRRKHGCRLALGLTALVGLTVLTIGCGGAAPTGSGTGQPSISAGGTNPGVSPPPPTLGISTTSLPAASTGAAYSAAFTATGGTPTYTWSLANGTLPAGVVLGAGGQLAGKPTSAGSYQFTAKVTDSGAPPQSAAAAFAISVAPISVAVSPTGVVLQTGMQQQFIATVSGAQNTGVLWQVGGISGGNSVVGTITANGTYKAPSAPPTGGSVVVTAISIADNSKSGSAVISVVAQPQPVTVAIVPNSVSVPSGQTQQFTASVTGTANTSVIWAVNGKQGGDATVGTISPAGLYTAPASVPANPVVTVTARSSYDSNAFASATVLIAASTNPTPTTYYLDATGGNDSNNGRSPATAWKNLDQIYLHSVNSYDFLAGSQILLKAGESWDGQIRLRAPGTAENPMVLGKYGDGANPIIYGDMHTAIWTAVPGHSGVYQANTGRGSTFIKAYEGSTQLTYVSPGALDLANSTNIDTYLNGFSAGNWGPNYIAGAVKTTVYVKTLDGSAPTNVTVFRSQAVYVNGSSYLTVQDLDLRQSFAGFTDNYSDHLTIQRVSVQDVLGNGIALNPTTTDSLVQNCTVTRAGNDGLYAESGSNNIFRNNAVSTTLLTVLGISTSGDGAAIGLNSNANTLVEGNSFQHPRGSCSDNYQETNDILRRNYCYDSGTIGMGAHGTGNVLYDNVVVGGVGSTGGLVAVDTGGGNPTLFYNNTVYGVPDPLNCQGTGQVIFRNNIAYGVGTPLLFWSNTNGNSVSDNNLFYVVGTPRFNYFSTGYTSLAAYSAASGQDAHSIFADPKFTDPAAGNFTLQASSPAINSGTNLGDTYKLGLDPRSSFPWTTLDQTAYGSGWEIGAFIFMPGR